MKDEALLKLLEAGIGEDFAAKQLDLPSHTVAEKVREYVEMGILRCAGDREVIDWRAYGKWLQQRESVKVA